MVYGVTGSGKSTMAARISAVTGVPWHSVDDLTWEPGWVPVPADEQRRRIATICEGDSWILDSGYSTWIDVPLARVELIVALDYTLAVLRSAAAARRGQVGRRHHDLQRQPGDAASHALPRLVAAVAFSLLQPQAPADQGVAGRPGWSSGATVAPPARSSGLAVLDQSSDRPRRSARAMSAAFR